MGIKTLLRKFKSPHCWFGKQSFENTYINIQQIPNPKRKEKKSFELGVLMGKW